MAEIRTPDPDPDAAVFLTDDGVEMEGPGTVLVLVIGVMLTPRRTGPGGPGVFLAGVIEGPGVLLAGVVEGPGAFLAGVIEGPGVFFDGSSVRNWTSSRLTEDSPIVL